jgi:hypothetical protein
MIWAFVGASIVDIEFKEVRNKSNIYDVARMSKIGMLASSSTRVKVQETNRWLPVSIAGGDRFRDLTESMSISLMKIGRNSIIGRIEYARDDVQNYLNPWGALPPCSYTLRLISICPLLQSQKARLHCAHVTSRSSCVRHSWKGLTLMHSLSLIHSIRWDRMSTHADNTSGFPSEAMISINTGKCKWFCSLAWARMEPTTQGPSLFDGFFMLLWILSSCPSERTPS